MTRGVRKNPLKRESEMPLFFNIFRVAKSRGKNKCLILGLPGNVADAMTMHVASES